MYAIEAIASRAVDLASGLDVVDYCMCLKAAYVVVSDGHKEAIGMAHVPHEDLHSVGKVVEPSIDRLPRMVTDLNPLNRALGPFGL
mgnify:CR=1 FL=1